MSPSPPPIRDARRIAILIVFALHGGFVGSLLSRIAEIQAGIGLGKDAFGLALIGVPAGAIVGSQLVGRLIESRGVRAVLLAGFPFFGLALLGAPFAFDAASLFAALALVGFNLSSCNVAMNVEADRVEAATGARLMNRCHGVWAVGFLAASLGGTAAVAAGVSPALHFLLALFLGLAATGAVVAPLKASPRRAHLGDGRPPRFALPTAGVLLIVGFAVSGVVIEGASRNWSIIYLRDDFAAPGWIATLSLPSFVMWQMVGRFMADGLIERFGPAPVARALACVSLAGLVAVGLAQSTALAIFGFALIGFGVSTVHPQAISAAAGLTDRPSSVNVAALSTTQIVIGFLAPPLFGFIAARYGVRASFAALLPLPVMALVFARALAPRR